MPEPACFRHLHHNSCKLNIGTEITILLNCLEDVTFVVTLEAECKIKVLFVMKIE